MGHETFMKRKKELARQEKQKKKAARRLERREEKPTGGQRPESEDPDIAGIRPGPQPKTY
ncbi:MAG: hypothetical protein A3G40_01570 [Deltaproteobacteria bacterium RIFCSPLOWO2_12_FULL_57_22]|nr:MAG: hypothetical protein A3G40_01570 [Deltaproteobacteria bacterium RIFCSPLOWO2_12_FULL_57_22]